jgi:hypothetical protein
VGSATIQKIMSGFQDFSGLAISGQENFENEQLIV